jgi:recombination protein RecA
MARKKAVAKEANEPSEQLDFTQDLIKSLNKEHGTKVAYNLAFEASPTHVKRWISTGSKLLDYIVSNRRNGGLPEGRIVEIFGPPSIGKSHVAIQIARSTQQMGGIVVYIDTENATSVENLSMLGVDISKRFVYVDTHCTEEVLSIAESTILKSKAMNKDVPITIVWDSVAASSPKAELIGDYDKESIGLQARAISKGMRKITGIIANQNVLFIALNQIRVNVGVLYGDPMCVDPYTTKVKIRFDENSLFAQRLREFKNQKGENDGNN